MSNHGPDDTSLMGDGVVRLGLGDSNGLVAAGDSLGAGDSGTPALSCTALYEPSQRVCLKLPLAQLPAHSAAMLSSDYVPAWIDVYPAAGENFAAIVYELSTSPENRVLTLELVPGDVESTRQAQVAAGRRVRVVDSYIEGGETRHVLLFDDQAATEQRLKVGSLQDAHQAFFNQAVADNFYAVAVAVHIEGGQRWFAEVYQRPMRNFSHWVNLTRSQFDSFHAVEIAKGWRPFYINAYVNTDDSIRYGATWRSHSDSDWVLEVDQSEAELLASLQARPATLGWRVSAIAVYQQGAAASFTSLWVLP